MIFTTIFMRNLQRLAFSKVSETNWFLQWRISCFTQVPFFVTFYFYNWNQYLLSVEKIRLLTFQVSLFSFHFNFHFSLSLFRFLYSLFTTLFQGRASSQLICHLYLHNHISNFLLFNIKRSFINIKISFLEASFRIVRSPIS